MKNGDRIRRMSNEELADFLFDTAWRACECCSCEKYDEKCKKIECVDGICEWRGEMVMRPVGSKKMTLRAGHKIYGVNITEELLADIRRMIYEGLPAAKVAMEVHITAMDIRMYAKECGGNLLEQLNQNEGCRTRKATKEELDAVKDVKGNTMCIYGTGWESRY